VIGVGDLQQGKFMLVGLCVTMTLYLLLDLCLIIQEILGGNKTATQI
jgi:hypothetical protein